MEEYRNKYLADHEEDDQHDLGDRHDLDGKAGASGDQGHDTDTRKLDTCTVS
jgi:hypothetical protein